MKKKYYLLWCGMLVISMWLGSIVGNFHGFRIISRLGEKMQQLDAGKWEVFGNIPDGEEILSVAGEIVTGDVIEQEFSIDKKMLKYDVLCISIYAATYARTNHGNLYFEIVQDEVSLLKTISMENMKDNDYIKFLFPTENLREGTAKIRCTSDGTSGNAVTVYLTNIQAYSPYLKVRDHIEEKNLKMEIYAPF